GADTSTFVDTAAPSTAIDAHPVDPTADASASFSFSASDQAPSSEGLHFECKLDDAAFAACASPESYSSVSDGSHTFQVRAIDNAGNADASAESFTWTVDTIAPNTTITSHPNDPSASSSAAFEFAGSDPGTSSGGIHFACSLDGGALGACSSPSGYSGLAEGPHTFSVQALDAAGNADATPATFGWFVDTTAPDTSLTGRPSDPTASSSASFTFSGSDASPSSGNVHFECSLDSAAFSACASPQGYSSLGEGAHTFRVHAIDKAGNVDATAASFGWLVDTVSPDTTITTRPSDPTASSSATFAFGGSDPSPSSGGIHFECRLDNGSFDACASPVTYTGLGDGAHTFSVRAIDAVANTDATPATHAWFVDTVAPDTSIASHPNDPSGSSSGSFTFNGSDPSPSSGGIHFECSVDGGAFAACASPKSVSGLADGSRNFRVRAVDAVGNTDATPASYTWSVDTAAPDTSITSRPSSLSVSSSASFGFTGSDPSPSSGGIHFECSMDGGAFSSCTSPKSYNLADGSHTFRVQAIDAVGNTDATPASFTWTIDTIAPDTTIGSKPSSPSTTTAPSFSFTSTESGSSFQCSLDGAAFAACASPQAYSGLAQGSHTFLVKATDAAGNTDATPASHTWTIDSIAPDTSVTSGPANGTTSTSATFAFTSTESGSTFQCALDAGGFATCTSPKDYAGLSLGSHTFQVKGTDAAGNTDASPASYTWTIKGIPPTVTSTTPSGTGVSVLAGPTATFSRAMDASTLTTSSFTLTPSGGSPVVATVSCNSPCTTGVLTPTSQLASSTTYTAQVTTAAKAADGTALASPVSWSFTTGNSPEVASKSPAQGASNVPTGSDTGTPVTAGFTRPMNGNTFTTSTFTLWRPDNTQVPATPSYNAATNTATITPTLPLSYLTTYTVKLTTGVTDANGVPLASPVTWTFTTTGTMISKRINAGGTAPYTDTSGNTWLADDFF
ncbi:MAG: large repetitive protein, partial [Gaiellaceae bacterium]|nr:large repetitive protein [Gaiellaceae bacterium]